MAFFSPSGRIHLVECHRPSDSRLEALVVADGRRQPIWFETDALAVPDRADPFLPILLPAAMASGLPLQIDAPLSAAVITAAKRVSAVMASWFPHWEELILHVRGPVLREAKSGGAGGQAVFFSGGVDSFRALQILRDQVQNLIFVHGFDIALEEAGKADAVAAQISEVAAETGTSLLKVRTNLREFTDRWVRWDLHQNGCALAAAGLLLRSRLDRVWIPSGYCLPFLSPYGSHPGLDSLWSLPGLELGHDTLTEDRVDKLVAFAGWALARRHLRVCWQPRCSGLNCGRCRKCLTTHAWLRGFCGDHHWPTFPDPLDLRALRRVRPNSQDMLARFFRLRDHLMTTGRDPQLLASVKGLLGHHQRRGPVVSLRQLGVRAHARFTS